MNTDSSLANPPYSRAVAGHSGLRRSNCWRCYNTCISQLRDFAKMRELYTCQTPILSIEALSHTTLEILMANPTTTAVSATAPSYVDDSTAQFVYFDMAPTFG